MLDKYKNICYNIQVAWETAATNEKCAGVAQWQSSWFVISRLLVRLRSPAPWVHTVDPTYKGDFPSGQRGQTVNLLSMTSVVRIHHPPPTKKPNLSTRQIRPFWMMFACHANDVGFANDDAFANDVCLRAHKGKHRIIAKQSGATSFWAKRKTSYRRRRCIIWQTVGFMI